MHERGVRERGEAKKADGEDEDIPARILVARRGTSNDILTNPTYVTPPVVFSLFRARPPSVHLHPVAVSPVEQPYFFVPRNYSSQITGPGCSRGKLIMLQRSVRGGVPVLPVGVIKKSLQYNRRMLGHKSLAYSGAGRLWKEKECILRCAA